MTSQLFPSHFTAMNLLLCQAAQGLYTGIPTLRLPQRKAAFWTTRWDKSIPFWNRGDSIFVNQNMLHGIRQLSGAAPDPLPAILFSGTVVAPENSAIYQKYIQPILACSTLPFVVFRHDNILWREVHGQIRAAYRAMRDMSSCCELTVQRNICCVLETIFRNLDSLPRFEASRIQLNTQIRLQKMLSYIYEHYAQTVTLGRYRRRRQYQPK